MDAVLNLLLMVLGSAALVVFLAVTMILHDSSVNCLRGGKMWLQHRHRWRMCWRIGRLWQRSALTSGGQFPNHLY